MEVGAREEAREEAARAMLTTEEAREEMRVAVPMAAAATEEAREAAVQTPEV